MTGAGAPAILVPTRAWRRRGRRRRRPATASSFSLLLVAVAFVSSTAAADSGEVACVVDSATLQLQQYDALRVARCSACCWAESQDHKDACETACLRSRYSKPGTCPDVSTLSAFDVACIDACSGDQDCSATDKCCGHACGITCQSAQSLHDVSGLPPIPSNLTMAERRHGRSVAVEWSTAPSHAATAAASTNTSAGSAANATSSSVLVLYVLEERHHVGRHLSTQRLGAWTPRHRSTRPNATLRGVVRPGRWYQFRVAAVNCNGSRGFSSPSEPFRLTVGPRPPGEPSNLSVKALGNAAAPHSGGIANATQRWLLRWEAPESDLPVQRYKVFWSRRLDGANGVGGGNGASGGVAAGPAHAQVSVLVNHQTVGGDVQQFILKSLEPNSLYFLQVQAIAQFGRERLKGEKAAIFLNTENPSS